MISSFLQFLLENEGRVNFLIKKYPRINYWHDNSAPNKILENQGLNLRDIDTLTWRDVLGLQRIQYHTHQKKDIDSEDIELHHSDKFPEIEKRASEHIVRHRASEFDPTDKKKYTDWLVHRYRQREFRLED